MKSLTLFLFCSFILLFLVQACAAVTGSGITTSPSQVNALKPGDEISEVAGTINLPTTETMTFNPDDSVEFYTQLDNAKWSIAININGNPNPARTFGGKHATIGGYDVAYPIANYASVTLQFSMTAGTVPTTFPSGTIILTQVTEVDPSGNQVGSAVFVNGTVISPSALQTELNSLKAKLASLKADINAKAAQGIDVSAAQQQYNSASSALDMASIDLMSDPSKAQPLLDTASAEIDQGNSALDRSWADYSIQQAKTALASVDSLLNEFTMNDNLKTSDPRLVPIVNERDLAAQAITNANDLFMMGQFTSARGKASDGLNFANQALKTCLDLKNKLTNGANPTIEPPSTNIPTTPQTSVGGGATVTFVVTTSDHIPLPGALVQPTAGISGLTDDTGTVIFRGLNPGSAEWSISKQGYKPDITEYNIIDGLQIGVPLVPEIPQPTTTIITPPVSSPSISNQPTSPPSEAELIAQLQRQNELLEQQNKQLAEQSNLLSQIISMLQRFLGIFGFKTPPQSQLTTIIPA